MAVIEALTKSYSQENYEEEQKIYSTPSFNYELLGKGRLRKAVALCNSRQPTKGVKIMSEKIEILVLVENEQEPKRILIEEDGTVDVLIREIFPDRHQEFDIFIEGEDVARERYHRVSDFHRHGHRIHCRHRHHHHGHHHPPEQVEVIINNASYKTHRGLNTVAHLRDLGHVPANEILSQFKDGQFVDLKNDANVEICGGEKFASHVASGGSS